MMDCNTTVWSGSSIAWSSCDNISEEASPGIISNISCLSANYVYPNHPYPPWGIALLGLMAGVTSLITTGGNILVVLAFILERSLRQPSNYLIASLAVTDILIGVFSMPGYSLYLLKKYWPLGQILCDLWLSLDYTVCLVSQYTVFLITLDRFFSVKAPAKYRNWRSTKKVKVFISVTWMVPAFVFFVTILGWRKFTGSLPPSDCTCAAEFQTNSLFTVILVISYYWVTLVIMIGLYIGIYRVALQLHNRSQQSENRFRKMERLTTNHCQSIEMAQFVDDDMDPMPNNLDGGLSHKHLAKATPKSPDEGSDFSIEPSTSSDSGYSKKCPQHHTRIGTHQIVKTVKSRTHMDSPLWKPRNSLTSDTIDWDAFENENDDSFDTQTNRVPSTRILEPDEPVDEEMQSDYTCQRILNRISKTLTGLGKPTWCLTNCTSFKTNSSKTKSKFANRARKAFRTITLILGAFVICWTPYHVVVIVHSFCSSCVNLTFYEFTYWLCYMNSPLNPFCYALANQQFKEAFIKIIKGKHFRRRAH